MMYKKAKEMFLVYLEAKGDSGRTVGTYDQRLRLFLVELGLSDDLELRQFTPEMIDRWVVGMRRRELAAATVKSRVTDVKSFFRWCVNRGLLDRSPAAHLSVKRPKRRKVKAIKPDDLNLLMSDAEHPRDVALMRFIASTGCRSGEAAGLLIEDLDLERREAFIDGKTDTRYVDFDKRTARAIKVWVDCHPNKECGFVFVGIPAPHHPSSFGTIYQMVRRRAKGANVNGRFNPHAVRHLVGQVWTDSTNLELTRQKLGHADISTTAVYANQDRERVKQHTDRIQIF